ncbi:hypothetical protein NV379_02445 [Paenibacillus sp. N1-5-1-14]|uniref:hypothetical protein n=1 Tax=Paenibacillus radicibacter TaxID=2972488 RepID=UPI002158AA65|nr:hypothetical protein [Paenibacillus radicibacter]MCR8641507.1 hypothetical protein [Paenibacillus radicibacter]
MKHSVGDSFTGQTMDTYHIVEVDEAKKSYKFKVLNEDGLFERFEEISEEDFESDMDWQML